MSVLNMSKADQALKLFYLSGLQYQLNNAIPVLEHMERDSESVSGSQIVMALRHGRQGGIGNRADDGLLPTPNSRKTKQAKWETKNLFARIQISDKTVKASRNSQGAFVSLLEADLEDAMTDGRDNMSRQVFGDGLGILTKTNAVAAQTVVPVETVQFLVEGMLVDICDAAGVVKHAELEVVSVDDTATPPTIKLSGAVTTDATDIVTVAGNYGLELTGFGAVFTNDNTLYGINRDNEKWFNATTINVNGELDEVVIQTGEDEVDRKAGSKTNFYVASYGVRRAYQHLLVSTKQIVQPMDLKGGYSQLTYNGKPFTVDKYAPAKTLFGLDMTTWRNYEMGDWDWLDNDGAVLSRVSGKAVWEATLARYSDLGCSKPRGNFVMKNITEH